MNAESERLRGERDLYLRLVEIREDEDSEAVLGEVLSLLMGIVGASRGLIQARDLEGHAVHVAADIEVSVPELLERISQGIVGEALGRNETVHTSSATLDPRFSRFESVRRAKIEAVVCAPIPGGRGVVYLQGPKPFPKEAVETVGRVAKSLGPAVARRLLTRSSSDPTAPWRARLKAEGLVGRSQAMADVLRMVAMVAPLNMPLLLTGPTGTGKSAVARVVHDSSPWADGPFVALNCAALPTELVESELFGAEPGAHSTATRRIVGKVEAASGGTLFLDEVGELPPAVQPKLLALLQSGTYHALGSTRARTNSARVIAATNADLQADIKSGAFREDLYHRLGGFDIRLPALSERRADIPLLADALLTRMCASLNLPAMVFEPAARIGLAAQPWTGNVRELENVVRRAAVFAAGEGCEQVAQRHIDGSASETPLTWAEATRAFQRQLLADALEEADGNVSLVGERLGIARSHLYSLLNAHGLR